MSDKSKNKKQQTVITNTMRSQFKKGSLCQAKDYADTWYKSRVLDFDEEKCRVHIHFLGWNSRYDQWFDINSNDIKTLNENPKKKPKTNPRKKTITESAEKTKNVDNTNADGKSKTFEIGDILLARWKLDDLFYTAHVLRQVMKGSILYYDVKFGDGLKKLVRSSNVRELTKEDQTILENNELAEEKEQTVEKNTERIDENKGDAEARRAEAELLLAIQNPHIKEEIKTSIDSQSEKIDGKITKNETEINARNELSNQRKSSRVKKLKTFKDEIVYYPPSSSKTYNIQIEEQKPVPTPDKTKIKRKMSASSAQNMNVEEEAAVPIKKTKNRLESVKTETKLTARRKKMDEAKKVKMQNYLKSLKLAKSKKSLKKVVTKKVVELKNTLNESQIKNNRKKKRDIIKKLIESSQLQLRKQHELIETQLKQHRHEKTKRKMLKLLKKQRLVDEQRHRVMENLNTIENRPEQQNAQNTNTNTTIQSKTKIEDPDVSFYHSNEPIRCNFSNCDKTFRKQSLLEYHLKYHHYVDMKTFNNFDFEQIILSTPSIQLETLNAKRPTTTAKQKVTTLVNEQENVKIKENKCGDVLDPIICQKIEQDPDWKDIYSNDKNEDPYDVVHCACGNHSSFGFMIQCEICLCWQHGHCLRVMRNDQVPDQHICWICTEPDNRLKQLKYKSWMQVKSEKKSREILDNNTDITVAAKLSQADKDKLNLLNLCSKKYFNLNLLMHTIEYQHALMNRMCEKKNKQDTPNTNKSSLNDQIEKLVMNISHLQDCATTKFEEFNKRLDEFEAKYQQNNKNALPRFFNLQELYKQLQSFVYT